MIEKNDVYKFYRQNLSYEFTINFKEKVELLHKFSTIYFTKYDFLQKIKNYDPNKVNGRDMISIRMEKVCDSSIYKFLEKALKLGYFLLNGKAQMWFQSTIKAVSKSRKILFNIFLLLKLEKHLKE